MLASAVGVDLLLAPYTSVPIDMSVWLRTAANGSFGLRLYDRPGFAYPPLVGNLLVVLGRTLRHLDVPMRSLYSADWRLRPVVLTTQGDYTSLVTSPLMNVLLKLLAIAPQLATGLLVVYAARRLGGSDARSRLAGAAWLFNPIVLAEVGIHAGALDLYVALFSLLAVLLVIEDRPGWAGVSLALGVLTKLTPLFLAPALIAAVARRSAGSDAKVLRAAVGRFVAGMVAAVVVILAPEALSGSLHAMATDAFLRAQNGLPGVGGLSIYGLRYLRPFEGITSWTFDHSGVVLPVTAAIDIGVAVAAGVWIYLTRRSVEYTTIAGCALVYLVVLLFAPVTNPQYLVWCLPFIVIVAGAWNRSFVPAIALGAAGCLYHFVLLGPLAPLAPLAEHSPILSVHGLVHATQQWFATPARLWGSDHAGDFLAPGAIVAIATMALLVRQLLRQPPDRAQSAPPRATGPSTTLVRGLAVLATVFTAAAVLADLPASTLRGHAQVVAATRSPVGVRLHVRVTGVQDLASMHFVAVPIARPGPDREVSVFLDGSYPIAGSSRSTLLGFPYHLRADARLARYGGAIDTVDAAALATELRDTARASRRVITVLAGAFPRSVLSTRTDLVTPWVRAGGVLVWGGDVIGYYSARPHRALNPLDRANLRDRGPTRLLGPASVRPPVDAQSLGTLPTSAAHALGLSYDRTGTAVSTDFAVSIGGAALGWDDGAFDSIVSVPRGNGAYLVFGGGIDDEAMVAQDLVRILSSRLVDASGTPTFPDTQFEHRSDGTVLQASLAAPAATRFVRISLLDASPLGVDSWHWTARIDARSVSLCLEPHPANDAGCAWDGG